jgi:hypothetical protein
MHAATHFADIKVPYRPNVIKLFYFRDHALLTQNEDEKSIVQYSQ